MILSLLPPPQGRLLSFNKVLFKVSFRVPGTPGILLANLKVSAVSWPLPASPHPIQMALAELAPRNRPEGAGSRVKQQPTPGRRADGRLCVRTGTFRVPLLPSACLRKRKEERTGKWMKAHRDSPHEREAGYQARLGTPSLGANTSAPDPHGPRCSPASPKSCSTSWLAAWRADGAAW